MESLFSLKGKVALITGASRGLGQGMAVGLAEAGATVIGAGMSDMSGTRNKIEAIGGTFHEVKIDLSQDQAPQKLVSEALTLTNKIDILVNNAGIIRRENAENFSDDDWYEVIKVNQHAVFQLCREAGRHMLENGSGKIVNVASMLSFQGGLRVPAYTASKHAVAGLTKSLANEWSSRGVNVNAIAPGYMETDNTAQLRANSERNEYITSRIPQGRWGTPEDLKGAVVFLASDASNYVNGHILCVDGGWMSS
ncbi:MULTISPECIES: 2-dehydro-3-deoxy-D-gluconate 5-dehydrogenase KduD [Metabacillus]|jgi:2-dehydro-3-deoxy-D-gluconate 5-dehydrogenase|uniref:2-deoxy-D-gluconate 3-dehydrogenase n=3 Tax=Metabacillus TaxID=2675233 RepID=A0A179T7Y5_9BACI|nr:MULTISPECIES: 2-dehydro-3-deoxy-D-gluconate 5-dehydrogenase KduD [Metabacillus]OAS89348.1 2-deoxy-D-gluconate 3-dehydrogenase [Metabacillus litoralis]QNF28862.1 2-dehydro-3-deoxy-D-gluconate 5-dehydrogenase KduD [Metabacillus sp. KUDC1714]